MKMKENSISIVIKLVVQDCPSLCSYGKNIICSSDGDSGDLSNYVVLGAGSVIKILKHVHEFQ